MTKPVGSKTGGIKRATDEINNRQFSHAIYEGVTMYDVEQLFHVTRRTVQRKLAGTPPAGKRGAYPTWKLKEIAGLFVKPVGGMEEFIKSATPGDLPVLVQKEYWNGLRAKQAFMSEEGDLWRTERVAALFGRSFQHIRTSLLLLPDELERRAAMTDEQRKGFQEGIDAALTGLQKVFQEEFNSTENIADQPGSYNIAADRPVDELEGVFDLVDEDDDEDEDEDEGGEYGGL